MGLNPHLINLMSVRERQTLEAAKASAPSHAVGQESFSKTLREAFAVASAREADGPTVAVQLRAGQSELARDNVAVPSVDAVARAAPAQVMNPERLLKEFLSQQDVLLAAHQMPTSRFRTDPDEETSSESGTRANLRPID